VVLSARFECANDINVYELSLSVALNAKQKGPKGDWGKQTQTHWFAMKAVIKSSSWERIKLERQLTKTMCLGQNQTCFSFDGLRCQLCGAAWLRNHITISTKRNIDQGMALVTHSQFLFRALFRNWLEQQEYTSDDIVSFHTPSISWHWRFISWEANQRGHTASEGSARSSCALAKDHCSVCWFNEHSCCLVASWV
jgi:hypothetical protein